MACQVEDIEGGDVELEDAEAEYDSMLIENAGDVIPMVARVTGGKSFVPYLKEFLPDLIKKIVSHTYYFQVFMIILYQMLFILFLLGP